MKRFAYRVCVALIACALLFSACSTNLGPETLPSTTPATEATETEPEVTDVPMATDPTSVAVVTDKIVEKNGALAIDGNQLVNSEGKPVVLKGISSYGIHGCEGFFTIASVKTLAEDWGCDVLRIAITGDEVSGGYITDTGKYFDIICKICDLCINQGIYVIVDWNVSYTGESTENKEAAVDFFTRISVIYSDSPNIIYEVSNEPLEPELLKEGGNEWRDAIKPFATDVIKAIRTNNPESVIIVDAPDYGIGINAVTESKLDFKNIAYGYKFSSGSTGDSRRDEVQKVLDGGFCVFATSWGFCNSDGNGGVSYRRSDKWDEFFMKNKMSWCNFAIGSDSSDDTNALLLNSELYTDDQKAAGHWPDGLISSSGHYAKSLMLSTEEYTEPAETTAQTEGQ